MVARIEEEADALLDERAKSERVEAKRLVRRRASEVEPRPVNWLWPGRIARGKVSIVAGHPGLGKSQLTVSVAAVVTTGDRWPVDDTQAPLGRVVILSAEDDPADTIVPRLMAAGAALERVEFIEASIDEDRHRTVDVVRDLEVLDRELAKLGDVTLLVVDPITAYLGGIDTHRTSDVRGALAPLADVAMRRNIAVVAVSHLRKAAGAEALMRITGSAAFVAAARATYVVAKDPEDDGRRLFLPAKNNLGDDRTGLAFRIEPATIGDGIETSRVAWESEPVTITADEALAPAVDHEARAERDVAAGWLRDYLSDGPRSSRDVKGAAIDAGLAWSTVRRAKDQLGIRARKTGFDGGWEWALPSQGASEGAHEDAEDAQRVGLSTFEHLGGAGEHLRGGGVEVDV